MKTGEFIQAGLGLLTAAVPLVFFWWYKGFLVMADKRKREFLGMVRDAADGPPLDAAVAVRAMASFYEPKERGPVLNAALCLADFAVLVLAPWAWAGQEYTDGGGI